MSKKIANELQDFSFVVPALAVFVFVIISPFLSGINIAFTDWNGITPYCHYVGLRNLVSMFHDKMLIGPFTSTLFFTAVTTIAINLFGLLLAVAVNNAFKGSDLIKTFIFMPMVVSLVLTSYMWVYVFNDFGTRLFQIPSPLSSTTTVMWGLCIMAVWRETGLAMVIYYAAIKAVPKDLLEAAEIDGASPVKKFFKVTVPFLAPAFTYCIPLWIGTGLKQFDYSFVATNGGPGTSSMSMAMYIYEYEFPYYKTGYAQMVALVYLVFVLIITFFVVRFLRKREIEL